MNYDTEITYKMQGSQQFENDVRHIDIELLLSDDRTAHYEINMEVQEVVFINGKETNIEPSQLLDMFCIGRPYISKDYIAIPGFCRVNGRFFAPFDMLYNPRIKKGYLWLTKLK